MNCFVRTVVRNRLRKPPEVLTPIGRSNCQGFEREGQRLCAVEAFLFETWRSCPVVHHEYHMDFL